MEDKILNSFFGSAKHFLNKRSSLTRYYSTFLPFLEGLLVTTTTIKGVRIPEYALSSHVLLIFFLSLSTGQ